MPSRDPRPHRASVLQRLLWGMRRPSLLRPPWRPSCVLHSSHPPRGAELPDGHRRVVHPSASNASREAGKRSLTPAAHLHLRPACKITGRRPTRWSALRRHASWQQYRAVPQMFVWPPSSTTDVCLALHWSSLVCKFEILINSRLVACFSLTCRSIRTELTIQRRLTCFTSQ